jgi:hypothetical protein
VVKIHTLVPLTHPTTDEEFPADTEVDVADDVAAAWSAAGKISLVDVEEANMQRAGHYTDITGRDDVAPLSPGASQSGPQTEDEDEDDEQPKPRRGKK